MFSRRDLLTAITEMLADATDRPMALIHVPPEFEAPYGIVYPLDTDLWGPPFAVDSEASDANALVQVTSVGEGWEQAEWLADKVRVAVFDRDPVTRAYVNAVAGVHARTSDSGPSTIDSESSGKVITVAERFVFHTTPE